MFDLVPVRGIRKRILPSSYCFGTILGSLFNGTLCFGSGYRNLDLSISLLCMIYAVIVKVEGFGFLTLLRAVLLPFTREIASLGTFRLRLSLEPAWV